VIVFGDPIKKALKQERFFCVRYAGKNSKYSSRLIAVWPGRCEFFTIFVKISADICFFKKVFVSLRVKNIPSNLIPILSYI